MILVSGPCFNCVQTNHRNICVQMFDSEIITTITKQRFRVISTIRVLASSNKRFENTLMDRGSTVIYPLTDHNPQLFLKYVRLFRDGHPDVQSSVKFTSKRPEWTTTHGGIDDEDLLQ